MLRVSEQHSKSREAKVTTTVHNIKCQAGGTPHGHSTAAQVRQCYNLAAKSNIDQKLDSAFGPIDGDALTKSSVKPMTFVDPDPATEPQVKYLNGLLQKRVWEGKLAPGIQETVDHYLAGRQVYSEEVHQAISVLKKCDRKEPVEKLAPKLADVMAAPTKTPGIKEMAKEIGEGRFATRVTEGGKLRFFLISYSRKGFLRISEYASDVRYPREWKEYAGILRAILRDGAENARLTFAQELGRCTACHRALTDENNPYKVLGYGPECGPKHAGGSL